MKDNKLALILVGVLAVASMFAFEKETAAQIVGTVVGGYLMLINQPKE